MIDNLNLQESRGDAICIEDFCGYTSGPEHFPVQYWAYYWTESKTLFFGGDWWELPVIFCEYEPTAEDCQAIADFYFN